MYKQGGPSPRPMRHSERLKERNGRKRRSPRLIDENKFILLTVSSIVDE